MEDPHIPKIAMTIFCFVLVEKINSKRKAKEGIHVKTGKKNGQNGIK